MRLAEAERLAFEHLINSETNHVFVEVLTVKVEKLDKRKLCNNATVSVFETDLLFY